MKILKDIRSGALPFREIPGFLWYLTSDSRKRLKERWHKEDWQLAWIDKFFPGWFYSNPVSDLVIIVSVGVVTLSIILSAFYLFVLYKDQWLNDLATAMVQQSIQTGASFTKIYAGFGSAVIIGVWLTANIIMVFQISMRKEDNVPEALADIAYTLEHKCGTGSNGIVS